MITLRTCVLRGGGGGRVVSVRKWWTQGHVFKSRWRCIFFRPSSSDLRSPTCRPDTLPSIATPVKWSKRYSIIVNTRDQQKSLQLHMAPNEIKIIGFSYNGMVIGMSEVLFIWRRCKYSGMNIIEVRVFVMAT